MEAVQVRMSEVSQTLQKDRPEDPPTVEDEIDDVERHYQDGDCEVGTGQGDNVEVLDVP